MSSWTFARHSAPKARKDHQCESCGLLIPKGYVYNRIDGLHDGEMGSLKTHIECDTAFHKAMKQCPYSDYEETAAQDLREIMEEAGMNWTWHIELIKTNYQRKAA
jgi:hypothetical protein